MFTALSRKLDGLRARYAEGHRAYHGQRHVDAMLADLHASRERFAAPDAAELAVWYHDAVYDPAAADNEERSARLLLEDLAGLVDPALALRAAALVRLTAGHTLPPDLPPELARDAALFLDLDLAVLGADPETFDAYERGIAAEYLPLYGQARYRSGRRTFLQAMLARPRLFLSEQAHARLDGAARDNIRRTIGAIG